MGDDGVEEDMEHMMLECKAHEEERAEMWGSLGGGGGSGAEWLLGEEKDQKKETNENRRRDLAVKKFLEEVDKNRKEEGKPGMRAAVYQCGHK